MKKTSLFAIVIIFVLSISCSNNHETETLPQTDCGTVEQSTMWWSSTQTDNENAWYRYINKTTEFLYSYSFNKQFGYSVRCIKD
jgi:uncharacterized protein (TIGR02145 family)